MRRLGDFSEIKENTGVRYLFHGESAFPQWDTLYRKPKMNPAVFLACMADI